jgi:hypothetical protein
MAGIVEAVFAQPFDTMKVLKQSNSYTSFPDLIKNPRQLYSGFTPYTSQMFVKYILRFTAFEYFKSKKGNIYQNFGAGVAAGFTESLFITPFELVKTNLQTTQNKNTLSVVKNIYVENGLKGMYRGFSTTAIRQCTNQGFNFSVYYKIRESIIKQNERPSILKVALASFLSSSIGPVLTSPIDVIKTRFMNPKYKYKNILEAFKDILKNESPLILYKGLGFRLIRVCGGQAITFNIVENLMYYTN